MELQKAEVIFYVLIAICGCVGGLCREWLDGSSTRLRRVVGRVFTGGVFSFGLVGIWIGHHTGGINGPFYFLGVSALIGFFSWEVQEFFRLSSGSIIKGVLKRVGIEVEDERGKGSGGSCN